MVIIIGAYGSIMGYSLLYPYAIKNRSAVYTPPFERRMEMVRKYKPATFQPTIRPDWGGVLSYIPDKEKIAILEALIKYPSVECDSKFWIETIKPDLDLQFEEFKRQCEAKSRGVRNRWGKTSITHLKDDNNTCNTDVIVPERIGIGESERIRKDEDENKTKKNKTLVSDDWLPDEKTREKLTDQGLNWRVITEKFINACQAKGYKYVNHNKAILAWDWSKEKSKQITMTNNDGIPY